MNEQDVSRFWSKVQVGEPDECWEWKGYVDQCGSGLFHINKKCYRAHNMAWALGNNQPYPAKLVRVMHRCSSATCCNPKHLYRANRGSDVPDEFWAEVKVGTEDECWPWLGSCSGEYGVTRKNGKEVKAHRVAFEIANGRELEKHESINWTCDNRLCCNPKHLYVKQDREPDIAKRFWSKVDVRGEDDCWEWQAGLDGTGYAYFWNDGKMVMGSRMSYELTYGPIPKGEGYHGTCVLHKCDNPKCVNPAHLRLGTHAENMKDRDEKGRCHPGRHGHYYYGDSHHNAKLTNEQADEIRAAVGISGRALAKIYGVSPTTIQKIKKNEIYTRSGLS